jgi:hypothetical protein
VFSLTDALELTMLIARKDPRRHPRVAARWLLRYLEEVDEATIDEAAMVCLPRRSRWRPAPGRGVDSSGRARQSDWPRSCSTRRST